MARATRFAAFAALLLALATASAYAQQKAGGPASQSNTAASAQYYYYQDGRAQAMGQGGADGSAVAGEAAEIYVDQFGNPIDPATAAYYLQLTQGQAGEGVHGTEAAVSGEAAEVYVDQYGNPIDAATAAQYLRLAQGNHGGGLPADAAASNEATEVYVDQYGNPLDPATAAYYQQFYAQQGHSEINGENAAVDARQSTHQYETTPAKSFRESNTATMPTGQLAGDPTAVLVESTPGDAPANAQPGGGYVVTPDGQYYYYYYDFDGAGAPAQNNAPAAGQASLSDNAELDYPVGTLGYLVPGADWLNSSVAMAQAVEEVPPLPGEEDEIDVSPPGIDTPDGPTFGTGQEEARRAIVEVAPLQFLRGQSVLLDKGERQIDIGLNYSIFDGFALVPQVIDGVFEISPIRIRQRVVLAPIEIRYGVTDHLQYFLNIPFGWSNTEVSFPGNDEFSSKAGIGDVSTGFSKVLQEGCGGYGPDVIATFAMTAPTGPTDFPVVPTVPNARLGQGYWAVSSSVLFIHTIDPVVAFYGIGYQHRFDATFRGGTIHVDPGETFIYQFGVGFGVNESVSLSTSFVGLFVTEDHVNGQRVEGGMLEPMRMRFAATFAQPCKIIEPFAEIGMTRDSAAGRVGITFTY